MTTKNPYEEAHRIQTYIAELSEQVAAINTQIAKARDHYERALAEGEASGHTKIGEFELVVKHKITERRTIRMDQILATRPEIILTAGTYTADLATKYLTPTMHRMLIRDPDFEKGYKLGLGELDKATGGKKNSAEYVDVEMQETTTKAVVRNREPIIEVL